MDKTQNQNEGVAGDIDLSRRSFLSTGGKAILGLTALAAASLPSIGCSSSLQEKITREKAKGRHGSFDSKMLPEDPCFDFDSSTKANLYWSVSASEGSDYMTLEPRRKLEYNFNTPGYDAGLDQRTYKHAYQVIFDTAQGTIIKRTDNGNNTGYRELSSSSNEFQGVNKMVQRILSE